MNNNKKEVSIIIPTYNERENINNLFLKIKNSLKNYRYEVIIVDDNSTDGTVKEVMKMMESLPVKIIVREKKFGLASAVVEGFKHSNGEILVVMDGDLQHPPEKILELIEGVKNGTDIVIASRKVNGGSMKNMSKARRIISEGAELLARMLFRKKLSGIKDIESGFFALKRRVIEGVELKPVGCKILLEILIMGKYRTIKEIGYCHRIRNAGKSKMDFLTIVAYLSHLLSLLKRTSNTKFLESDVIQ